MHLATQKEDTWSYITKHSQREITTEELNFLNILAFLSIKS